MDANAKQRFRRTADGVFRMVVISMLGILVGGGLTVFGQEQREGAENEPLRERGENPRLVELQRRLAELQKRLRDWRRETEERLERWWNQRREALRRRAEMEDAEPLEQPVLLEFRLEPGDDLPARVVTASTRFEIETSYEQRGAGSHLRVEGSVEPVEKAGKILYRVRFDAVFESGSGEEESHASCRGVGSVVGAAGRPLRLLALGDTELVLTIKSPDAPNE